MAPRLQRLLLLITGACFVLGAALAATLLVKSERDTSDLRSPRAIARGSDTLPVLPMPPDGSAVCASDGFCISSEATAEARDFLLTLEGKKVARYTLDTCDIATAAISLQFTNGALTGDGEYIGLAPAEAPTAFIGQAQMHQIKVDTGSGVLHAFYATAARDINADLESAFLPYVGDNFGVLPACSGAQGR